MGAGGSSAALAISDGRKSSFNVTGFEGGEVFTHRGNYSLPPEDVREETEGDNCLDISYSEGGGIILHKVCGYILSVAHNKYNNYCL